MVMLNADQDLEACYNTLLRLAKTKLFTYIYY